MVISLSKVHRLLRERGFINKKGKGARGAQAEQLYEAHAGNNGVTVCPFPGMNLSIPLRRARAEAVKAALAEAGVSAEIDITTEVFVPFIQ